MKILVAYDGSDSSKHALNEALRLAKPLQAELILLTAIAMTPNPGMITFKNKMMQWGGRDQEEFDKELEKSGRDILQGAMDKTKAEGIKYKAFIELSAPRYAVCERAKKSEVDLIVVGARGLGLLDRVLLGSVTQYVVQHAHCSVLVTKLPKKQDDTPIDTQPPESAI